MLRTRFLPLSPSPTQETFLASRHVDAAYISGPAGGKTTALVMAACQWLDVPGYHAILFRRRFTDLTMPGGLRDTVTRFLGPPAPPCAPEAVYQWTVPRGGMLTLATLPDDDHTEQWQRTTFGFVGFDQVGEFPTDLPLRFMLSRLRPPAAGLTPAQVASLFRAAADGTTILDVPLRLRVAFSQRDDGPGMEWATARYLGDGDGAAIVAERRANPCIDYAEMDRLVASLR